MIKDRLDKFYNLISQTKCSYKDTYLEVKDMYQVIWNMLKKVKKEKNIVYIIGNGGSAGIASHFCTDLINKCEISTFTLVDSNVMTCMANDYGYESVYSRPLSVIAKENDLLFAISSSGQSQNIINAVSVAKKLNLKVITLSGFKNNCPLRVLGDLNIWLNAKDYGLVEMGHFFILHTLVDLWNVDIEMVEKLQEVLYE